MKAVTLFAIVGSLATLVSAQFGLPSCASGCIGQLPKECTQLDFGCFCKDKDFLINISCCVAQKCSPADQEATIQAAKKLCLTGGVTIGSTAATCPSTSAAAAGSSSTATAGGSSSMASAQSITSMASMASMASAASSVATSAAGSAAAASTGGAIALVGQGLGAVGAAVAALAML